MSDSVLVAPSLSTAQTEETFEFQSYEQRQQSRSYLDPQVTEQNLYELVSRYYSVPELIRFFREHQEYRNITLQFPDELVVDSSIVVQLMQQELGGTVQTYAEVDTTIQKCGPQGCGEDACEGTKTVGDNSQRKIWILADTAYSPCCVDEVASEHVQGDIVVHFGDACLNPVQKLHVVYSFGRPQLDLQVVVKQFKDKYQERDAKVCLMADAPFSMHMRKLYELLHEDGYERLVFADINQNMLGSDTCIVGYEETPEHDSTLRKRATLKNRNIYGCKSEQDQCSDELDTHEYELFHITIPQDPHLLFLTTNFQAVTLYDPKSLTLKDGPFPSMMRRYRFMHMARTAGTIGILINTLSLKNTKETINKLTALLKENGKKHYLFVVGKPNVAKLANFEPIDIWCILGCGQGGIIIDQNNEFYKPIITPYELLMALTDEVTWTGQWVTDFQSIINDIHTKEESETHKQSLAKDGYISEDDAPEFSAVTGKYVSTSRPLRPVARLEIETPAEVKDSSDSTQLVKQFSKTLAIKNTVSTSAAHLQSRHWTGLGSDYNDKTQEQDEVDSDGATVEEGTAGIARSYQFDQRVRN